MKTSRLLIWLMLMLSPVMFFTGCEQNAQPTTTIEGTVSGVLQDEDGLGVPEAAVTALDAQNAAVASALTDEDGNFSFVLKGADENTLKVRITGNDFKPFEESFKSFVEKNGNEGKKDKIRFAMRHEDSACGKINVIVRDSADGSVMNGVEIKVRREGRQLKKVYTNANGNALINYVPQGTFNLRFAKDGYKVLEPNVTVGGNCDSVNVLIWMNRTMSNGDTCCNGKIILYTKDSTTNSAIQNATIKLWLGNVLKQTKTSNQDGRIIFEDLCPGDYSISMNREGYAGREFNIGVGCNQTIELTKKLLSNGNNNDSCCNGKLVLYTKDSTTNAAIQNAIVKLWQGGALKQSRTSESNGRIVFENICPGTYGISINREGYFGKEFNITFGCNDTIELTKKILKRESDSCCGGKIILYTRDSTNNAALNNSTIKLWLGSVLKDTKISNIDGRIIFENLCPGTYGISMMREGYASREFNITITCNQTVELTKKLLANAADTCCTGDLIIFAKDSATNAALQNGTVKIWRGGALKGTRTTNSDGRATFEDICEGTYGVDIIREGYTHREFQAIVTCGGRTEITKKLLSNNTSDSCCTAQLKLRVKDSTTFTYISGAEVVVRNSNQQVVKQGTSNNEGWAYIQELCSPAVYYVTISKQGYGSKTFTFTYNECKLLQETIWLKP
ncbi:MAG: carboxypeptidase regulatory-like domain-containing protein [Bacteroidota bacterium]